ncbi:FecR family protein [Chryseosolibacter indicus]|uniref:FecR domain-containing protein n=1 Tax=Chryseosolibacter indicus TaxID=2782351 RepID=A0ABS5VQE4_9BACT|nr:FecR domain-containing protein [Chryseosolibacter indicus]
MKDYSLFSEEDFVNDEFFRSWVLTPNERTIAFWTSWLADHPEKKEHVEEAKRILKHLRFSQHSLSNDDISALWNNIKLFEHTESKVPTKKRGKRLLLKIAASIIVFISFGITYYFIQSSVYLTTYNTAFGETKMIQLPDSSTVILNSNSALRFSDEWESKGSREVWLDGEAFFSVVHLKNNKPFKVLTGEGVAVEVLGTSFNVYHRVKETKVVLNSGKIKLQLSEQNASQNIEMKPGDFIEYKNKSFSKKKVNPKTYSAWTENKLILDHTSLREMVSMLRMNYGVEVTVNDERLLNQTVSGSMPITNVESLIQQIAQSFQIKVERKPTGYVMYE